MPIMFTACCEGYSGEAGCLWLTQADSSRNMKSLQINVYIYIIFLASSVEDKMSVLDVTAVNR